MSTAPPGGADPDEQTPPAVPSRWPKAVSALELPHYRTLWMVMLFSMAAMQANIIARGWLAYDLTGSGLALGLVVAARGLPQIVLAPLSGVVADRFDKRLVVFTSQAVLGVLALGNAVLVHLDVVEVWHLVVIGVIQGMLFPFNALARQAYVPEVVRDGRISNALALYASGRNAMQVVAPAFAGVLIAVDPALAFYSIAVFYLGAFLMSLRLPSIPTAAAKGRSMVAELTLGFRYSWNTPILRALTLMLFVIIVLGRPYQQLLPVFQVDIFRVSEVELGVMYTTIGVGSLLGSVAVALFSDSPRKGLLMLFSGVAFGGSIALFAITGSFLWALGLLFASGLLSQVYTTLNSILIVLHCDRSVYGRVVSVRQMIFSLMTLSTVPIGALVDVIGVQQTVAIAGVLVMVCLVLVTAVWPQVLRREVSQPESAPAPVTVSR